MKTLLTFATLSLIALGSLGASAQVRKTSRSVQRNKRPFVKIQVGATSRYGERSFIASRVRQLENVVNMMQDRILDLEYEMSMVTSSPRGNQYFCEIIGKHSGRSYTAQASTQRQASSQAYSKCVNSDGSFWCDRNRVNCDPVGPRY